MIQFHCAHRTYQKRHALPSESHPNLHCFSCGAPHQFPETTGACRLQQTPYISNQSGLADCLAAQPVFQPQFQCGPCVQDAHPSCACNPAQADHAAAKLCNCPEPGNKCEAQRQHSNNGRQAAVSFLPVSVPVMLSCERMTFVPLPYPKPHPWHSSIQPDPAQIRAAAQDCACRSSGTMPRPSPDPKRGSPPQTRPARGGSTPRGWGRAWADCRAPAAPRPPARPRAPGTPPGGSRTCSTPAGSEQRGGTDIQSDLPHA